MIVTQGTVTDYEGHDKNCTPHVCSAGMSFVDLGGPHVHIVRNETSSPAATVAIRLIPANQSRRIDAPDPGNCSPTRDREREHHPGQIAPNSAPATEGEIT